jgi:hypothetical protein
MLRNEQLELSRDELRRLKLEKVEEKYSQEGERTELLEQAQAHIAAGDYPEALEAISSVEIGGFWNSSDLYDFNCDVLFYRMVALGEHALSSLDFNSEAQRKEIDSSLTMAADVMRRSPERSSDVRDLAMKLQHRVVAKYLGGLSRLYQECAAAEMGVANVKSQSSLQLVRFMCTGKAAGNP